MTDRTQVAITEIICDLMTRHKVSRRELARRMGCAPANITQVLGGRTTMQIGTLSKILTALGYELEPRVQPLQKQAPVAAETFPERLLRTRTMAKISIRKLAAAAKISPTVVGSYESGRTDPARAVVERIAAALGVDAGWLAYGSPK